MTRKPMSWGRRAFLITALTAASLLSTAWAQEGRDPTCQEPTEMKIRMTFNGQSLTATLYDNPSARDFYAMLPLDLTIENYGSNEKIVYLPRKLTLESSGPFGNERPGDIGYWSPWGNLALYHADYHYDPGLVRLGRWDGSFELLRTPGTYPVHLEHID